MSAPRKYISEFGLNVMADYTLVMQQDGLREMEKSDFSPHIYMVCRRPRISIDPGSINIDDRTVSGTFYKHIQDQRIPIPFITRNQFGTTELTVESKYPFTEVAFVMPNGENAMRGKSALVLGLCGSKHRQHLDLEVMYVGQSYGTEGSRNAMERLQKHETLQGIYAAAMQNNPDQDIWLALMTFQRMLLASFDGITKKYETTMQEDDAHRERFFDKPITMQQEVNFTEAALIKYFQPEYNVKYKETFPSPGHSSYSQCYDVDLNAVAVEIQSEDLNLNFWSPAIPSKSVHIASFPLHDAAMRRSMFEI